MKKNLVIGLMAIMLLSIGMVSASNPGYHLVKDVVVTGDWSWNGCNWENGVFPTATYKHTVNSPTATFGGYNEVETMGTPWEYKLSSNLYVDNAGTGKTEFKAWTVNDPVTTPATGGYTTYGFLNKNYGEFSTSTLHVYGEGAVDVKTVFKSTGAFYQDNTVVVN